MHKRAVPLCAISKRQMLDHGGFHTNYIFTHRIGGGGGVDQYGSNKGVEDRGYGGYRGWIEDKRTAMTTIGDHNWES